MAFSLITVIQQKIGLNSPPGGSVYYDKASHAITFILRPAKFHHPLRSPRIYFCYFYATTYRAKL
jgi:hypothetical protein